MIDGKILYDNFTHVSGVDRDGIVARANELRERIRANVDNDELREAMLDNASEDRRDRFNR